MALTLHFAYYYTGFILASYWFQTGLYYYTDDILAPYCHTGFHTGSILVSYYAGYDTGFVLVSCYYAGFTLTAYWLHTGFILAPCRLHTGVVLASYYYTGFYTGLLPLCWLHTGFILAVY